MSNVDSRVNNLVINSLTKEQYDAAIKAGTISDTELYMITDVEYPTTNDVTNMFANYTPTNNLANVATSGEYSDILNKPSTFTPESHTHTKSEISDFPIIPTISDVYNATSSNGMSGKAVASAISDKQNSNTAVTHTASTKVGDTNKPVYVASDGKATACSYELNKSVPSNAVFTDTTYSEMTGATSSDDGTSGLVPAPASGKQSQFLRGDGTWATPTNTKNTAGSSDTSSKIFLIGATSQTSSSQTYSHDTAFVDTNGRLNSNAPASDANDTTVATTKWVKDQSYVPNSRTINSKSLSGNITLSASDVGALPDSTSIPTITDTYSSTSSDGMSGKAVKSAIDTAISSVYKAAGSIAFASRPTPGKTYEGNVYNITDDFTTDSTFVEGSGKTYPAGTNIVCINTSGTTYKWDVLSSLVDLSGYQLSETAVTHTASTKVGNTNRPVYIASDGKATQISYTIDKSVPSNAVFTDTTYSNFEGTDGTSTGTSGLVPAPATSDKDKFLCSDGSWGNPIGTTYNDYTGATSSSDGVHGLVPSATSANRNKFLRGDATWQTPTDTKNTTGGDDTSSKIFLVGMTAQTTNNGTSRTYTHDTAFVDANGRLNSNAPASSANDTTVATTKWVKDQGYITSSDSVAWSNISGKPDTFTPEAHNQASNTINAMTGYSKASSASAIETSDSLNTAIGKLEKSLDSKQNSNTAVTHTASTKVGDTNKPVYVDSNGTATACSYELNKSVPSDAVFTDTNTLMTQNVSTTNNTYPILLCPTANASSNQGAKTGIFASGVKVNPSTSTITATTFSGNATTASTASKLGSSNVGNATTPIYLVNGTATAMNYTIEKSVPSNAVFTDTTYSEMTAASSSSSGTSGLVPAPASGKQSQFLRGDATWATPTDTKNTTGGDDTSSKIFLVGMTAQTTNNGTSRTYSHDTVFVDTNGRLNSNAPASSANDTTVATTKWVKDQGYAANSGVVHTSNNESISGSKTFNNEIKGTLVAYQSHNSDTGGLYRKQAEIILTGAYQSAIVPFFYYKDAVNTSEVGYQGKISLRVDATAGTLGTGSSGVVLCEYPNWISNGNVLFYVLYKNNTPESNQVTCEIWSYVKNAWDGYKIIPLSYHGYSQSGWTWYNNPTGVTSLPTDYSQINQKYGRMYTVDPDEDTTSSKQIDTVGARNTKLSSYALNNGVVHTTGNESISGTKTFTSGTIISKSAPGYALKATNITRATPPSSNQTSFMLVETDNNNKNVGGIYRVYNSDGGGGLSLLCYKPQTTDATYQHIKIGYDGSGNYYTYAPTPSTSITSTSDTNIATTGWTNTRLGNYQLKATYDSTNEMLVLS